LVKWLDVYCYNTGKETNSSLINTGTTNYTNKLPLVLTMVIVICTAIMTNIQEASSNSTWETIYDFPWQFIKVKVTSGKL